ncbi:MAG: hypothetical protein AB7U20_14175, partial [Planctomycetaceae bacterium]
MRSHLILLPTAVLWSGLVPAVAGISAGHSCDGTMCDGTAADACSPGSAGGSHANSATKFCDSLDCEALDWLNSDQPALQDFRDQTLFGDVKYSVGGVLRYRWLDERNR